MVSKTVRLSLLALLLVAAASAAAQAPDKKAAPAQGVLHLLPGDAVSERAIDTPGGRLDYTATAGTLSLYDQSGERTAAIFYTAYVAKGAEPASRPVTFVFNGGPGASAAYLHLGLVGPRIA
jgi:carboxypeptidase C (cathepsin A)